MLLSCKRSPYPYIAGMWLWAWSGMVLLWVGSLPYMNCLGCLPGSWSVPCSLEMGPQLGSISSISKELSFAMCVGTYMSLKTKNKQITKRKSGKEIEWFLKQWCHMTTAILLLCPRSSLTLPPSFKHIPWYGRGKWDLSHLGWWRG